MTSMAAQPKKRRQYSGKMISLSGPGITMLRIRTMNQSGMYAIPHASPFLECHWMSASSFFVSIGMRAKSPKNDRKTAGRGWGPPLPVPPAGGGGGGGGGVYEDGGISLIASPSKVLVDLQFEELVDSKGFRKGGRAVFLRPGEETP